MQYYALTIHSPHPEAFDVLVAELSELGFEGFVEENDALKAFIPESDYSRESTVQVLETYTIPFQLTHSIEEVKNENWNALWESNFQPVFIEDKLIIRALFHEPQPEYPMEIVIQPKMSFGTGHHATTWSVMKLMLEKMDFKRKKVFDFGTGTGILAILAKMLGAGESWAVDNDPQCTENSEENFQLNRTEDIQLRLGDIYAVPIDDFDIIIGNITRNVILSFLPEIGRRLVPGGYFVASGFYQNDLAMIESDAHLVGLQLEAHTVKDNWCAALFKKG